MTEEEEGPFRYGRKKREEIEVDSLRKGTGGRYNPVL